MTPEPPMVDGALWDVQIPPGAEALYALALALVETGSALVRSVQPVGAARNARGTWARAFVPAGREAEFARLAGAAPYPAEAWGPAGGGDPAWAAAPGRTAGNVWRLWHGGRCLGSVWPAGGRWTGCVHVGPDAGPIAHAFGNRPRACAEVLDLATRAAGLAGGGAA